MVTIRVWLKQPFSLYSVCGDLNPHVVCIVETWLDNSVLDNELTISNYFLVRLDRNRHGGGVLLYIRGDLSYNVIFMGPDNLELLGVTLYIMERFCLFVHCTVHLPQLTLFCSNSLFFCRKLILLCTLILYLLVILM